MVVLVARLHGNENQPKLLPNIATHAPKKISYYNPMKSNYHTAEQYKQKRVKNNRLSGAEKRYSSSTKQWTHRFFVTVRTVKKNKCMPFSPYIAFLQFRNQHWKPSLFSFPRFKINKLTNQIGITKLTIQNSRTLEEAN